MIRKLFQNLRIGQIRLEPPATFRFISNSAAEEPELEEQHNYVKLMGTVVGPARPLLNGTKSLIVRTRDSAESYCNHHVNIITKDHISSGERIYIFGNLRSKPFNLDDGRLRHRFTIKTKYYRMRGQDREGNTRRDQNNVKILGKISSVIKHSDDYSLLTLKTSHTPKGEGRIPGLMITDFHTVMVYDQPALGVVRNIIKKFDRVIVEGKLSYFPHRNSEGKTLHGGVIIAQSIKQVER